MPKIVRKSHRAVYEKFKDGTVKDISDDLPFEIPTTWRWVRLTDITEFLHRGKSPVYVPKSGCPMFAQKCNQWDGIHLEKCRFCSETKYRSYPVEYHLHDCDVVINSTGTGTLGRVGLFVTRELEQHGFKSIVPDSHVTIVRTPDETLNRFIFLYLRTDLMWKWMNEIADGSTKQKQVRIMRKIEKLVPVVEEYGKLEETRLQLDADLPATLEKSILQEAIQGKLVPQDPNDEPASELLKRIANERKALVKAGKLKRDKGESVIFRGSDRLAYETRNGETVCIQDEIPFNIPHSWEWVRLGNVVALLSGRDLEPSEYSASQKKFPYMTGASNFVDGKLLVNRWTDKFATISHNGDLLITCKGTIGAMAFNTIGDIHIARQIMAISSHWINLGYVKVYLESIVLSLKSAANSMIPGIDRNTMLNLLIPLPPLDEQKRIVKRVEELKATARTLVTV